MIDLLKNLFSVRKTDVSNEQNNEHILKVATCAIFIELANIDENFSEAEKIRIVDLMKNSFNLNKEEVDEIIKIANEKIEKSVSVYEFTDIVNKNLSMDEKYQIIKNLWLLAFEDNQLDTYENHFIKKISDNLHISNKDRIAAKFEVKNQLGI